MTAKHKGMEVTPSTDVVVGVLQLANLLTRRLAPMFKKVNITPQQFTILLALANDTPPENLAGLAERMLVSKQNMTGMVQRLEQAGFIDRNGNPADLRKQNIVLTRRGRTLVEKFRPAYEQWSRQLGTDVSERDFVAFARTLDRLIDRLS